MATLDTVMFPKAGSTNAAPTEARIPEWLWLNPGYEVPNGDDTATFIPLPYGLPVGTMKPKKVNSANAENPNSVDFQQRMQAGNDFLTQIVTWAKTNMKPGDTTIVSRDPNTGICLQLQRVKEPAEQTAREGNPYKINFGK